MHLNMIHMDNTRIIKGRTIFRDNMRIKVRVRRLRVKESMNRMMVSKKWVSPQNWVKKDMTSSITTRINRCTIMGNSKNIIKIINLILAENNNPSSHSTYSIQNNTSNHSIKITKSLRSIMGMKDNKMNNKMKAVRVVSTVMRSKQWIIKIWWDQQCRRLKRYKTRMILQIHSIRCSPCRMKQGEIMQIQSISNYRSRTSSKISWK